MSFLLVVVNVLGAMALLLFGIKLLSESLQKLGGRQLRNWLTVVAGNPARGLLSGFLLTALLQSSSATTVLLVGFVNSGLISVYNATGLIFGANIGTTVTTWLITFFGFTFNIKGFLLPLLAFSIPLFFSSRSSHKSLAELLIGFSLLFFGLQFLKDALPPVDTASPLFNYVRSLDNRGFLPLLLAGFTGMLVTLLVQSSTATITLTIILLSEGYIGFEVAAAMVVGENIGTTATANLAALIANRNAKRSALIHTLFNLAGAVLIIPFFIPAVNGVSSLAAMITHNTAHPEAMAAPLMVSLFHSLFNLTFALLFLPFVQLFVKAAIKIIPLSKEGEQSGLYFADSFIAPVSELAVIQINSPLKTMSRTISEMLEVFPQLLTEKNQEVFASITEGIRKRELFNDELEKATQQYLSRLGESKLSHSVSRMISTVLIATNNMESIADICYKINVAVERKNSEHAWFTQEQRNSLMLLYEKVKFAIELMDRQIAKPSEETRLAALANEAEINTLRFNIIEKQVDELRMKKYPLTSANYFRQLAGYLEKVADHALKVVETLAVSK
ncbi:MAG: Na/Pi cotransporter family protein [Bacteroidia bacterium]|jgi:phosphate:Na+ symporter|nr:Na/Pi cotransporter family protein [Bacteroidia bacterium]